MKSIEALWVIGVVLLVGCSQSANPNAEFQQQEREQRDAAIAAAKAIHFNPTPGEIQIIDLPDQPTTVELRFVWERSEHRRYHSTVDEENSATIYFLASKIGSMYSNAIKLPENMEEESFLPGWLQITATFAGAGKTTHYYINEDEITLDRNGANKLSLSLFKEVPARSPATMPMGEAPPR